MKKSQALTNMKLTLKPEHQKLIEAKLNTGRYANPDEVIAEALQLLIDAPIALMRGIPCSSSYLTY
ncbi:MAG: type II toxin-antitoxin system ParD family antitoxin [Microcystis sp.]